MVIVIAVTGLASFSLPDYRMSFAVRMTRFIFLLFAAAMGLVGVTVGLYLLLLVLCSMKSFGVPYLVPYAPKTTPGWDTVSRGPVTSQEIRPDDLNTQGSRRQSQQSKNV